jgi:hypothetical protein
MRTNRNLLSVLLVLCSIISYSQPGTVLDKVKVSLTSGGFPGVLQDNIGGGAGIGDFDGDGVPDMTFVDGAYDDGSGSKGAFWIALMNPDGSFKAAHLISNTHGGFTAGLQDGDSFGAAESIGDFDGDGVIDLVVSAAGTDDGGTDKGAFYVLFMNADATVKSHIKIGDGIGGMPSGILDDYDRFGRAKAIGDIDDDGITDIGVGVTWDDDGGLDKGAFYVLFMNADGTVRAHQKISDTQGGFTGGLSLHGKFATGFTPLGDLDGDGVDDIAIGEAWAGDFGGAVDRGQVWIMFLNTDGTVKSHSLIGHGLGGFPAILDQADHWGGALTTLGDIDGDDVVDMMVGCEGDDDDFSGWVDRTGSVYTVFLNPDGTAKSYQKISELYGNLNVNLGVRDIFGSNVNYIGDLNGDGKTDVSVAAGWDDDGITDAGAIYILFLDGVVEDPEPVPVISINCGGGAYTDSEGVNWISDNFYDVGISWINTHLDSVENAVEDELYFSEHVWGQQWGGYGFSYRIPIPNGNYEVLLKFAEIWFQSTGGSTGGGVGSRIFDVEIESAIVLDDYDIFADVGSMYAVDHSFPTTVTDGFMDIRFLAEHHNAKVSAIQIRALPADFCAPPVGLSSIVSSPTDLHLSWNEVPGAVGYRIQARDIDGTKVKFHASGTNHKDLSFPFESGQAYEWRVRTACADDTSAWSDPAVFLGYNDEPGTLKSVISKISDTEGGFDGGLGNADLFGQATSGMIGDLDKDGINDLAVSARYHDHGGTNRGAFFVLLMNSDGSVKDETKIASGLNGMPVLDNDDLFGQVTGIGDLDGDGTVDIMASAVNDDDGGTNRGAVYILLMNSDGSIKDYNKITSTSPEMAGLLDDDDRWGFGLSRIQDLDGNGTDDILVGAEHDDETGPDCGAVYVLFMEADASVKRVTKIGAGSPALMGYIDSDDHFGINIADIGDLDQDGIADFACRAYDDDGGPNRGALYIVFMNTDGTARSVSKISDLSGGFEGELFNDGVFGQAALIGDLNGDGIQDLAAGAIIQNRVWVLLMNSDGTVMEEIAIDDNHALLSSSVDPGDEFGLPHHLGDWDGDGVYDLILTAQEDDDGGTNRGAVYLISLNGIPDTLCNKNLSVDSFTVSKALPGDCSGEAEAHVSGGLAPYSYWWNEPSNQTAATASDLCPGSYPVVVIDAHGCRTYRTILVEEDACPTPDGLVLSSHGTNWATLSWNSSPGADKYRLFWREAGSGSYFALTLFDTSFTIGGLIPGTDYEAMIGAVCGPVNSMNSDAINFTLPVLREAGMSSMLQLSPNPANGFTVLSVSDEMIGEVFRLLDSEGRTINTGRITADRTSIPLKDLSPGQYAIVVDSKNDKEAIMLIVQ